jgi:hypothetical protein
MSNSGPPVGAGGFLRITHAQSPMEPQPGVEPVPVLNVFHNRVDYGVANI